jgi:hypothetical protein
VKVLVQPGSFLRFQTTRTHNLGSAYVEHWPGAVAPALNWNLRAINHSKQPRAGVAA